VLTLFICFFSSGAAQTSRGIEQADIIVVDEAGFVSEATINEGVLPGFPVDKTIVIFISTINNRNNDQFFTRLLKRKDPDVGILLFSLRCEKCVESNRDLNVPCPHRIHFIPEVRP